MEVKEVIGEQEEFGSSAEISKLYVPKQIKESRRNSFEETKRSLEIPPINDDNKPSNTPKYVKTGVEVVDQTEMNIFNDKSVNFKAGDGSSQGEESNSDASSQIIKLPDEP